MKIEYDKDVDALYVRLQEKYVARTVEIEDGLNLDIDNEGKLIGLEILDATRRYSLSDIFNISTENLILDKDKLERTLGTDL
jgi:uncharacterized protein YuzE